MSSWGYDLSVCEVVAKSIYAIADIPKQPPLDWSSSDRRWERMQAMPFKKTALPGLVKPEGKLGDHSLWHSQRAPGLEEPQKWEPHEYSNYSNVRRTLPFGYGF